MAEHGRGDHAGPQAGERAGPDPAGDRVQPGQVRACLTQRLLNMRCEQFAVRPRVHSDPLAKGAWGSVVVELHHARGDRGGGGVDGEYQHIVKPTS